MDILTVFCEIDDFCNEFEPRFNQHVDWRREAVAQ